jgi:hypothetical protein
MRPVNESPSTAPISARPSPKLSPAGAFAVTWGVGGFVLLLGFALWRLTPMALESFDHPWGWPHITVFVFNLAAMAWFEGYQGFQKAYSPRFAARCRQWARMAGWPQALVAPLVCMGFLHAPRRRIVATWLLTAGIVGVVLLYRQLPQPWRGILDAGVVLGLAWGLAATLVHVALAFRDGPRVDPELVTSTASR